MSIPDTELTESVQLARDLLRMTLHGAPPLATTMRIAEALVALATTARKMDTDLATLQREHTAMGERIKSRADHLDRLAAVGDNAGTYERAGQQRAAAKELRALLALPPETAK